jgi:hypothetical protein
MNFINPSPIPEGPGGLTSGNYSLSVFANTYDTNRLGIQVLNSSGSSSFFQALYAYNYATGGQGSFTLQDSNRSLELGMNLESAGGNYYLFGSGNYDMYFATNTTERMRIKSDGNVGIGTDSPLAKLEIIGGSDYNVTTGNALISFQYSGGGYRHFIKTRHLNGNHVDDGNAIDFYLNTNSINTASSSPGTGNSKILSIQGSGLNVTGQIIRNVAVDTYTQGTTTQTIANNTDTLITNFSSIITNGTTGITYSAGVFTNNSGRTQVVNVIYTLGWAGSNNITSNTVGTRAGYISSGAYRYAQSEIATCDHFPQVSGSANLVLAPSDTFGLNGWQNSGTTIHTRQNGTMIQITVL